MKTEKEKLLQRLPKRYADKIRTHSWTKDELEAARAMSEQAMRNDLWFGIPWFVIYTAMLLTFGFTMGTIAILVVGIAYFGYSMWKFGSYGINRKRVKIYDLMLQDL